MCYAGVSVQLSDQEVVLALQQQLGQQYDKAAGQRLMQHLLQRADDALIGDTSDTIRLGQRFPLLGYRSLIRSLASGLAEMEGS